MNIKLYTIAERVPPPNIEVIRWWVSDSDEIITFKYDSAEVSVCAEDELDLLGDGEHPNLVWNSSGSMYYDDIWSYCRVR